MPISYPAPLPADEQIALCKRAKAGDIAARNRLVETTMRMVVARARRWSGSASDIEDLISEGSLGVIRAIERFDPDRGFRFSTYAQQAIDSFIRRGVMRDRDVNLSRAARSGVLTEYKKLIAEGMLPEQAISAAAKTKGMGVATAQAIVDELQRPRHLSLDAPISENGDPFIELISAGAAANDAASAERRVIDEQQREIVAEAIEWALQPLDERARDVLRRRYLSDDDDTLLEVGEDWGVTRELIRQVEESALVTFADRLAERLGRDLPEDTTKIAQGWRCGVCGGANHGRSTCKTCGAMKTGVNPARRGRPPKTHAADQDLENRRRVCSTCTEWFTPTKGGQHRCDRCLVPPAKRSVFDQLVPKGSPDAERAEAELKRRRDAEATQDAPYPEPSQPLSTCAFYLCAKRFRAASTAQRYGSRACDRDDTGTVATEPAQPPPAPRYVRCSRPGCGSVISPPPRLYQPGTLVYCGTKCSALSAQSIVESAPPAPQQLRPTSDEFPAEPEAEPAPPPTEPAPAIAPPAIPAAQPVAIAVPVIDPLIAPDAWPEPWPDVDQDSGAQSEPIRLCDREGCGTPVAMPPPGRRGMKPRYCSHSCRDRANYLRDVARREAETRPPAIAAGEQPQLPATLICEDCGREFERNAMGPLRKACRECNPTWYEPNPQPDPRPCARSACGETFQPLTEAQIYCSLPCRQAKENRAASERAKARDAHEAEHGSHGALEKTCAYAKCSRTFLTDNPRRKHCTMACAENAQKARARDRARLLTQSTNEVKYGGAMGDVVNMKRVCQLKTCGTEFAATSADQRFCSSEHETEERCLAGCDAAHKPRARFRVLPDGTIECDDPLDALELRDLIAQRRSA